MGRANGWKALRQRQPKHRTSGNELARCHLDISGAQPGAGRGIVLLLKHRPAAPETTIDLPSITQTAAGVAEIAPATNSPASERFHWSMLVSEDLKVYRD